MGLSIATSQKLLKGPRGRPSLAKNPSKKLRLKKIYRKRKGIADQNEADSQDVEVDESDNEEDEAEDNTQKMDAMVDAIMEDDDTDIQQPCDLSRINVSDNKALAESFANNLLEASTKAQYTYKIKHFRAYMAQEYPECFDEATLHVIFENIPEGALSEFMAHVSKKKDASGEYVTPMAFYSISHVNGYSSAIKHYHYILKCSKMSGKPADELDKNLKGFVRKIEQMKITGEIPMNEGKAPMSFEGYKFLADKAIKSTTDFSLASFAHLFLLLCWNLIARCVSVATLTFSHISWEEDAMTVTFPTHKGDKEGKNAVAKHVYANPLNPHICPILSFAVYIWTSGYHRAASKPTVFGDGIEANEGRFSSWLRRICSLYELEFMEMGLSVLEVGTHSFRKGIATFISGMPGGPSPISIYLRAGWSLGKVVCRYILDGLGGDNLCGRAATGLSLVSVDFSMLPPHFDQSSPIMSLEDWDIYLPGYSTYYPEKFRKVIPFLLASLCYHKEYLDATLHTCGSSASKAENMD